MKLTVTQIRNLIREEYARGIPEFAISQVASDATEQVKRLLVRHIGQRATDPRQQRQMLSSANVTLDEMEKEIKEKIEEKLLQFINSI